MVGAVLDGADLRNSDLSDADIAFSSLKKADVRGAKFLCKRIESADLQGLVFDEATIFPDGWVPGRGMLE